MALFNKITITFNQNVQIGWEVRFRGIINSYGDNADYNFDLHERFVMLRTQQYTATTGEQDGYPAGTIVAMGFKVAIDLDYGPIFGFITTRVGNVVTIEYDESFSLPFGIFKGFTDDYNTVRDLTNNPVLDSGVVFSYGNVTNDNISITNVSYASADSDQCQKVKVLVTTSQLAENYKIQGVTYTGNTNNPIEIDLLREQGFVIQIWNNPNLTSQGVIETPGFLNPNLITINVIPSPNGPSINIINSLPQFPVPLGLEYSLDGTNWQSEAEYQSLENGNYTLYIRDSFGCQVSKEFSVTGFAQLQPYFYIDKANSIRYANRVIWGTGGNYKNDENTLSCEAFARDENLAHKEIQMFQTNDVITTQIKSNYESIKAFVVLEDENNTEVEIPVVKKSDYIGRSDLRDSFRFNIGNGKNGVYFTTGNIYDFNTELPTGQTHYLNGYLPTWARIGAYFRLNGTWHIIESIYYDEMRNAEVIVFSGSYTGMADELVKSGALFNVFDFEIYEFKIDFDSYIDKKLRVRVEATNSGWTTITYLSEIIDVKVNHNDCVEIRYWDENNTNINYQTEIKHLIRIPIDNISGAPEGSSENYKTDTTTLLISSEVYEADVFKFEPLTKELWRKIMIALSCEFVFINNIQRVKNGDFEVEGPLEDSNLYVLSVNMIKTGSVFTSQSDGFGFDNSSAEIVGLIDAENQNYIRY